MEEKKKDYLGFGVSSKRPVEMDEVKMGYLSSDIFNPKVTGLFALLLFGVFLLGESGILVIELLHLKKMADIQFGVVSEVAIRLQNDIAILVLSMFALTVGLIYYFTSRTPVYLIDFAVCEPEEKYKISHPKFMETTRKSNFFSEENCDFQEKILYRSGLGDETYFPPGIMSDPFDLTMSSARQEVEYVLELCFDELFKRTNVKPKDIDIIIVNCSLFNPTPSIAAIAIRKYGMRENVKNYNLSGMGCSAGVISIDLAKDLLQVHPNSLALVFSTENITQNWYRGNDRSMIVSNCLFRMGGAAMLLSNRKKDARRAKYQLLQTVRIHKGSNEVSYRSVFQEEDDVQKIGVRLSKDLIKVVSDALKSNLTVLGPLVLPWSEQFKFFINLIMRKVLRMKVKPYTPDFKKAFEHYAIHAGGRAVIDGLEQNLKLEPKHVLPSRATLYRVGNTSSSSIWYELAFTEQTGRLKKGDRLWQIAFGSGFKCNSAVWKALRNIDDKARRPFWANLEGLAEEYQVILRNDRKYQR